MRKGYYKFMGNTVEYWGGEVGYDMDSRREIPLGLLQQMGEYIGEKL